MQMMVGAGILVAGMLVGRFWPARKKTRPVCDSCGHGLGNHDPKSGECKTGITVHNFNEHGTRSGSKWDSCACLRYVGPKPPDSYYMIQPVEMDAV